MYFGTLEDSNCDNKLWRLLKKKSWTTLSLTASSYELQSQRSTAGILKRRLLWASSCYPCLADISLCNLHVWGEVYDQIVSERRSKFSWDFFGMHNLNRLWGWGSSPLAVTFFRRLICKEFLGPISLFTCHSKNWPISTIMLQKMNIVLHALFSHFSSVKRWHLIGQNHPLWEKLMDFKV